MKANNKTESEVKAVLQTMADAYAERDLRKLMRCFAPDVDAVLYGTGADEKRIGPEEISVQVHRDWAQTEAATMVFASTSVSAAGTVAWAAIDGSFKLQAGGQNMNLPARITFVLEKRDGNWLIVHSHFSTPAAHQEDGKSF